RTPCSTGLILLSALSACLPACPPPAGPVRYISRPPGPDHSGVPPTTPTHHNKTATPHCPLNPTHHIRLLQYVTNTTTPTRHRPVRSHLNLPRQLDPSLLQTSRTPPPRPLSRPTARNRHSAAARVRLLAIYERRADGRVDDLDGRCGSHDSELGVGVGGEGVGVGFGVEGRCGDWDGGG
ncbi:uncharacterized protein EV422DRAFT_596846, partial [Fimicolochytrium jonesii]|uniref:uncharacterized protein n=1 Tax=Fimicolochytrium jonesii TaxID=1396493 RepID=UPI0022FF013D